MAVSEADVLKPLLNIKSNAVEEDVTSLEYIKVAIEVCMGPLMYIINHCYKARVFQQCGKKLYCQWQKRRLLFVKETVGL